MLFQRPILFRSNPQDVYARHFIIDYRGILIVTRRFIFATGIFARVWG